MAEQSTQPVKQDVEKLRKAYLELKAESHKILGRIQQSADKEFPFTIQRGSKSLPIRFRRLTYGEALLITQLPFFDKVLGEQKLTDEEENIWMAAMIETVEAACLDKNRWRQVVAENPKAVEQAYAIVAYLSGLDPKFMSEFDEFMDTDMGRNYGNIWIGLLHKTPSEVAALPFMDVMVVNIWAAKWLGGKPNG